MLRFSIFILIPFLGCSYALPRATFVPANAAEALLGAVKKVDPFNTNMSIAFQGDSQRNVIYNYNIVYVHADEHLAGDWKIGGKNNTLKFYKEEKSWNEARKACMKEGGHLAIIRSAEEEKRIFDLQVKNACTNSWIGIFKILYEDWVTVLGQSLNDLKYVSWIKGEPNGFERTQACVMFKQFPGQKGLDDHTCSEKFSYVCEFPINLTPDAFSIKKEEAHVNT